MIMIKFLENKKLLLGLSILFTIGIALFVWYTHKPFDSVSSSLLPIDSPCGIYNGGAGKPQSPVHSRLTVNSVQGVGGTADLILTICSEIDGPTTEVLFNLPDGIQLIEGQQKQYISLKKEEVLSIQIKVKLLRVGEQKILAGATIQLGNGNGIRGASDAVFLDVMPNKTVIRREARYTPGNIQQTVPVE